MENKLVGWLLIGIGILVGIMFILFSNSAKTALSYSCPLIENGLDCPAAKAINQETYFGLTLVSILVLVGVFLLLSKPKEKIIIRNIGHKTEVKKLNLSALSGEEKKIISVLQKQHAVFQADLIEQTQINKVRMSRILDRLEGRGLIERKRRGMQNIVLLKE